MHFTGTIWRPPYEAESLLLEVTAGCTHHSCKFCTLYNELPFKFRMSPLQDVESDLQEMQLWYHDPIAKLSHQLQGTAQPAKPRRVFLVGANPFVLSYDKLMKLADLIKQYLPTVQTIGCFARITDIGLKSDEQLNALHKAGYNGITIGMETADDAALAFMHKGYTAADILTQCKRLEQAQIAYSFFYLAGISGRGHGEDGAKITADLCNQLRPWLIGANMLTVYPDSALFAEIQQGNWHEESELEKYREVRTLAEHLQITTEFAAMGASNAFQFRAVLPQDRPELLALLDKIIAEMPEEDLQTYRRNLPHL